MSSFESVAQSLSRTGPLHRLDRWVNTLPHPGLVCEIAPTHVAATRWNNTKGSLGAYTIEALPDGAVAPSPLEPNLVKPEVVRSAIARVFRQVVPRSPALALLIPDPVVRVFILQFESFPRRADEAAPLLRLRLKKSVPFDVDETVVSWMRQPGRETKIEIVAAVARSSIVREYEEAVEAIGLAPGVVLSSSLASLPLIETHGATLFARMSGRNMTTAIVRAGSLCVYRSAEMAADAGLLEPQAALDEVFPAIAYFQDTWKESLDRVRVAGFGPRKEVFRRALANELKCSADPISEADGPRNLPGEARELMNEDLEPLVGWMMNGSQA
ncbi:MAG: hypothetical protein WBC04_18300 [Candidatus Acidiferrales bacterium]